MMKIVLLNGPKDVGKDSAAVQYITKSASTPLTMILSIMRPSKMRALCWATKNGISGLSAAVDTFERVKDVPSRLLGGRTPREVYIEYGEMVRKDDPDAVIKLWRSAAEKARDHGIDYLIVPDCRFSQELIAAVDLVGAENVCLVNVYRPGHDWTGDIGQYLGYGLKTGDVPFQELDFNLYNDGAADRLGEALAHIVEQWEAGATFVEKHTGA